VQEGSQRFWDLWRFFHLDLSAGLSGMFSGVYFRALLEQVPKMAGLFLVVCFGSCM
jgi:SulP family sulfate permease